MSEPAERPPRRTRYSGKNPRRFADKYKERQPELYPETVAKVIASGKTPAGSHVPIMVEECLAALALRPGQTGVDATLGHGVLAVPGLTCNAAASPFTHDCPFRLAIPGDPNPTTNQSGLTLYPDGAWLDGTLMDF